MSHCAYLITKSRLTGRSLSHVCLLSVVSYRNKYLLPSISGRKEVKYIVWEGQPECMLVAFSEYQWQPEHMVIIQRSVTSLSC